MGYNQFSFLRLAPMPITGEGILKSGVRHIDYCVSVAGSGATLGLVFTALYPQYTEATIANTPIVSSKAAKSSPVLAPAKLGMVFDKKSIYFLLGINVEPVRVACKASLPKNKEGTPTPKDTAPVAINFFRDQGLAGRESKDSLALACP